MLHAGSASDRALMRRRCLTGHQLLTKLSLSSQRHRHSANKKQLLDFLSQAILHSMSSVTFDATLLEVAKAHLRDAFLLVQPPLTRAIKAIFVRQFGAGELLSKFKSYLGRSMQDFAVDDGRAFDMYASLLLRSVLRTGPVGYMNARTRCSPSCSTLLTYTLSDASSLTAVARWLRCFKAA